MTTIQYGIWTNIFDYTAIFILFSGLLPFWANRFMARGKVGTAKTSVSLQLIMAIILTLVYFPVIVLICNRIGTTNYLLIYVISGFFILTDYMVTIFESLLQTVKPHAIGYGLFIEEVVKVGLALIVFFVFKQLFLGAMLAIVVSYGVQVLYYWYVLKGELTYRINWAYLKEWAKGSIVFIYNEFGVQLFSFIYILLFIYGGADSRAYVQAALSFTAIVGYCSSLSFALFPKLLARTSNDKEVTQSLDTILMLALPLATTIIIMASSFLTILNKNYSVASSVLVALTVDTVIVLIHNFYASVALSMERLDAEGKIPLRQVVKSKMFKIFTIPYVQAAIALPVLYFVLTFMHLDSIQSALIVVGALIILHVTSLVIMYIFTGIRLEVNWTTIIKYVSVSAIMGLLLFVTPISNQILPTIVKASFGLLFYVGLLSVIDLNARTLILSILKELKTKVVTLLKTVKP